MKQKQVTVINNGMNRDLSVSKIDKSSAYNNRNIRIIARDQDTLLSVTNERGNKLYELPGTILGDLVGWNVLNGHIILFTHENSGTSPDHIYRVDYRDDDTTSSGGSNLVTVAPPSIAFAKGGGSATITIRGNYTSWIVTAAPAWTDANGKYGSTSTLLVTASENTGETFRMGTITISVDGTDYYVNISQPSNAATLYVTPDTVTGSSATEFAYLMEINDESTIGWRFTTSEDWIHFGSSIGEGFGVVIPDLSTITGTGNHSERIYVSPNTGAARTGYLYLYDSSNNLWQTVTVTQPGQ